MERHNRYISAGSHFESPPSNGRIGFALVIAVVHVNEKPTQYSLATLSVRLIELLSSGCSRGKCTWDGRPDWRCCLNPSIDKQSFR